jgi:hydroxyethylthiazole kinase-like uncharacterized protein yjeF
MTDLVTTGQMRAMEHRAMSSGAATGGVPRGVIAPVTGPVTGRDLMERAGQGVVDAVMARWPAFVTQSGRAVVLCGPGNNGGDGFVVARLLLALGWRVEVLHFGDSARLPADAGVNYARWCALGRVHTLTMATLERFAPADLYVDAVFGIGLTRPLTGPLAEAFEFMAHRPAQYAARMVAVDVPSGLEADSGRILLPAGGALGVSGQAALTVTFQHPKLGHYLAQGPDVCGALAVCDIGIGAFDPGLGGGVDDDSTRPLRLAGPDVPGLATLCKQGGHKYNYGHALVLSGPMGRTGAARLAARGALRIGAGVVSVGAPEAALPECAAQLTAIMLARCEDASELTMILEDTRINVLCLGPGLGLGGRCRALVLGAARSGRGLVLDADALTEFAEDAQVLWSALRRSGVRAVLTPHDAEFARLFPDIAERMRQPATRGPAFSKVEAVRCAAARSGCVVLLKGPDTVIAAPDGTCAIAAACYSRDAPMLATAGAGDVLAGFIAGLLAKGLGPFDAAQLGAWLHVEAGLSFGHGLIAEDLPEQVPVVLRKVLTAGCAGRSAAS